MSDLPPPPSLGVPDAIDEAPEVIRERPPSLPPPPDFMPELAAQNTAADNALLLQQQQQQPPQQDEDEDEEEEEEQEEAQPDIQAPTEDAPLPPTATAAAPAPTPAPRGELAPPPDLPPPPTMEDIQHMDGFASISKANKALHALQANTKASAATEGNYPTCTECKGKEYPVLNAVLFFLGEQNPRQVCLSCVDTMRARKTRVMEAQATLSTPLMDGWLLKRKAKGGARGGIGGWKKRYCVLLKGGLHYYKGENRKQEMGVMFPPNIRKVSWTPSFHTMLIELTDGTLYEIKAAENTESETDIVYWYKAVKRMIVPEPAVIFEGWLNKQKLVVATKDTKKRRWCKLTEYSLEYYVNKGDDQSKIAGEAELIGASKPDCFNDTATGESILVVNTLRDGIHYLTVCKDSAELQKWQESLSKVINSLRVK